MTVSENSMKNNDGPLEFPYAIEPMFWGTGEMLVWEFEKVLAEIDRDKLLATVLSHPDSVDSVTKEEIEAITGDQFRMIAESPIEEGPRGYYSFFPVLPEENSLVILDPSDFHSELQVLSFHESDKVAGWPIAAYIRADGDVIAFSTFSTGLDPARIFSDSGRKSTVATVYTSINRCIQELLETRINSEIRRAMGIDTLVGKSFSFNGTSFADGEFTALTELLCCEERLGVSVAGQVTTESCAQIRYFLHHPDL